MGLFQRVGDILSANLNEMVEKLEDPEKMLKQAIREMESAVAGAKRDVVQVMASEKLVQRSLADSSRQVQEWEARASQAVLSGDDALARKALSRKQEHQKIAEALRDQLAATSEACQTLRRQLDAMQARLAEAGRRLGALVARKKAADVLGRLRQGLANPFPDQQAFEKFNRLREKVERLEAEADALRELEATEVPRLVLLSEVPSVDRELAALKKKLLLLPPG